MNTALAISADHKAPKEDGPWSMDHGKHHAHPSMPRVKLEGLHHWPIAINTHEARPQEACPNAGDIGDGAVRLSAGDIGDDADGVFFGCTFNKCVSDPRTICSK